MDRIQRYHEELGHLDTVETARRRSQELIQELRIQRRNIDQSERDLEETMAVVNDLVLNETKTEESNPEPTSARRWLDENWSLGSERVLAGSEEDQDVEDPPSPVVHTDTLVR